MINEVDKDKFFIIRTPQDIFRLMRHIESLYNERNPLVIMVRLEEWKTLPQVRYLHWIFRRIAEVSGESIDVVKERIKRMVPFMEDDYGKLRSIKDLTRQEISELIQVALVYADEFGLNLPRKTFDE